LQCLLTFRRLQSILNFCCEVVRRFKNVLQRFYCRYDCHTRNGDYRLYTIVRSIIGFTRGSEMSCLLSLPHPPFPLSSRAWGQTLRHHRTTVSLSHISELSATICSGLIIGLKCLYNVMFCSILPVFRAQCFLRIDPLVFSISLAIFSRLRTLAMFVSGEVSTTIRYVTVSQTR